MLLSQAVDLYKADRIAKGFARGTVANEQSTLRNLLAVVGNVQVSSINSRMLDKFWFKNQQWGPGTANKNRDYLASFFKWCQMRGHMPRTADPLEGLRRRRVPPRDRSIIPVSRFEELLDAAPSGRSRAIVAIGLYLFCRVSEISLLRWRDLDFDSKTVSVFREKTQTIDVLPMCEELELELRRWRLEYGRLTGEVPKSGWFVCPSFSIPKFAGRSKAQGKLFLRVPSTIQPLKRLGGTTDVIKTVLAELDYDGPGEGGHTLRRSGAVALYDELIERGHDGAIRLCQAMLGHSSVTTTEIYLRLDLARKTRNDLLAGKRMFSSSEGDVVSIGDLSGRAHGQGL